MVEKIAGFSNDRLEAMLNEFLTKEFRFVEVIGAALGFLIGLLQILHNLIDEIEARFCQLPLSHLLYTVCID